MHPTIVHEKPVGVKQWTMGDLIGAGGQILGILTYSMTEEELAVIASMKIPTWVVTGSDDVLIDPAQSMRIYENLNWGLECQFDIFKGAGHMVVIESSDRFNEGFLALVRRHSSCSQTAASVASGASATVGDTESRPKLPISKLSNRSAAQFNLVEVHRQLGWGDQLFFSPHILKPYFFLGAMQSVLTPVCSSVMPQSKKEWPSS